MARYFFNIIYGDDNLFDKTGVDLESTDIRDVRARMVGFAVDHMIRHKLRMGAKLDMEVLDERGTIVASMNFGVLAE